MRVALSLVLALAVVGCESLRPAPAPVAVKPPPVTAPVRVVGKPADVPKTPVEVLRASATQAPAEDDPLLLVAQCLERDDHLGAATHLERYVRRQPDQPMFRLQLAELYLRADRKPEAKCHYERFIADTQSGPPTLRAHLVTAHIKLRDIAVSTGDRFGEPFHRGVGLLLLVKEQDGVKDRDEAFCEEMLCKALRALMEAKEQKPGDARVRVYLAEAHDRAGNRHAADTERAAARTDVVSGALTASERGGLLRE